MRKQNRGSIQMRTKTMAGIAGVAAILLAATAASTVPAAAQELSEKSVRTFMDYAWSMTPNKFTKPDGKTVVIDKSNRDAVEVPIDMAREVIKVARMTAHAQMCDLAEDQVLNYRSLMKREDEKKKWSEGQMIYINQLHLVTVMLLNGKLQLVETEDGKEPKVVEEGKAPAKTCTAEQRQKVKEIITAYVKSGPPVQAIAPLFGQVQEAAPSGNAAAAAPAAGGAQPVSATAAPAKKTP